MVNKPLIRPYFLGGGSFGVGTVARIPLKVGKKHEMNTWDDAIPSLKLTASLHLNMDGWNTIVSFWGPAYFQGLCYSGRVISRCTHHDDMHVYHCISLYIIISLYKYTTLFFNVFFLQYIAIARDPPMDLVSSSYGLTVSWQATTDQWHSNIPA